ncbi:uncharacterized protein LOC144783344 [Lissotriton helveticus]
MFVVRSPGLASAQAAPVPPAEDALNVRGFRAHRVSGAKLSYCLPSSSSARLLPITCARAAAALESELQAAAASSGQAQVGPAASPRPPAPSPSLSSRLLLFILLQVAVRYWWFGCLCSCMCLWDIVDYLLCL